MDSPSPRLGNTLNPSGPAGNKRVSKRVVLSYILDWVLILFTGALGRIFKVIEPNRNAFSLRDPSISYPYAADETVSVVVLVVVSLVVPAVVILVLSLLLIPGRTHGRHTPKSLVWQRKLWEWNAGWMGFAVAYAGTYAATEGLKLMFGKPRPDLLSRCDPDLSDIGAHVIGGLRESLEGAPSIVSWTICQNRSEKLTRDGFVSFPSGHSSMSFAGLTYLSLWLCSKLSITFPYHPVRHFNRNPRQTSFSPMGQSTVDDDGYTTSQCTRLDTTLQLRNQAAAPPAYLLLIAIVPVAAAAYIASSRWVDNRHFGFDIIFGSILGAAFAWVGFRLYNLPLKSGSGWAWGPRSQSHAFFAGFGSTSYVDDISTSSSELP